MKGRPLFITGTDTGVGKTVLTCLLAAWLRESGCRVAGCKPICSGGREDAELLAAALGGQLALDEVNPWHFRAPIAPVLAARAERKRVGRPQIVTHLRGLQKRFDRLLIEGAGGLLSPLAEKVDSRAVITAMRATPIIVGWDRLGVINQIRLTMAALPPATRARAVMVLMTPEKPDDATGGNRRLLAEYFDGERVFVLPWFRHPVDLNTALKNRQTRKALAGMLNAAAS